MSMSNSRLLGRKKTEKFIEVLLDQIFKNPQNQTEVAIDPDAFYRGVPTLTEKELFMILKELTLHGLIEKVHVPTVPLSLEPNSKPEVHRSIYIVPKPIQLLEYLQSIRDSSSFAEWERPEADAKRELTKE